MSHDSLNPAVPDATRLDLTPAQRGIWYAQKLAPENPMFQIGQFIEITGPLDEAVLASALERAVAGTDALNLGFAEDTDGPFQYPRPGAATMEVTDLAAAPDPEAQARALMDADLGLPRDAATDQLLHTELIRLAPDRHFFYQRVHHLLLDGYSAVLVLRRVAGLYNDLLADDAGDPDSAGITAFAPLQDLLAAEAGYAGSAAATADKAFWDAELADAAPATGLAGRPDAAAGSLVRAARVLRAPAAAALESAAATAPALILTAASLYLHRITGEREVSVALPVTARRGNLAKSTPSMLSNIVPVRLAVDPGATVQDTAAAVGRNLRNALVHQRFRYEDLPTQGGYLGPSVNILPVLDGIAFGPAQGTVNILSTGPVDDLSIVVHGLGAGSPTVQFEANAALYGQAALAQHVDRFVRLLERVATQPGATLADLTVTTQAEELDLLAAGDAGDQALPGHTIVEEFQLNAAAGPDRTAVVAGDGTLTFAELEARSNQLARYLASHGAGPGTTVAVRLDRSLLLPIALLAVLKSGAAYLPLDPDYPAGRVEGMIEDAAPVRLLTSTAFTAAGSGSGPGHDELATDVPVTVLDAALMAACLAGKDPAAPLPTAGQQDLAYVIFTSGSTGRPKGVGVEHLPLLNLYTSHRDTIFRPAEARVGRKLRVAHTAGLSFDASWDPILWLIGGHELHLVDNLTRRDPEALSAYLSGTGIDSIETTPSFAKVLVAGGLFDQDRHPSVVALGGEAVDAPLWNDLAGRDGVVAYNFYGPTETTVDSLTAVMEPGTEPTLGGSVANTRHYILDSGLNPVPDNAVGELYVAGINLARGYLDQPGLSAERFVADPFAVDGSRMYRTGDIVRRQGDGTLEFRGRLDAQVKIRGFRIELAEIEQVLRALDGVEHAAVTVGRNRAGYDQLLGYVTPAAGVALPALDTAELRRLARRHLPDYMVPATITQIPVLPLTPNGKLDTRALPVPDQERAASAPRNERERIVADAFKEVLGLSDVGLEDDFFDLGGHSLLATRLVALLRDRTGTAPALRTVFEKTTVAELAETLELGTATARPLVRAERPEVLPLSFAQRRLWFLNRFAPESGAYNIPVVLNLPGKLDVAALAEAIGQLAVRHETLRTLFPLVDGEPAQRVLSPEEGRPALLAVECTEQNLPSALAAETGRGFDLGRDLPLRAVLFQLAPDHHVLAITLHHIAADGWSLAPLARDLSAAYNNLVSGGEAGLAPLPVQYVDYTLWQRAELGSEADPESPISRQLDFWTRELRGAPEELLLPFDYARGTRDEAAHPAGGPASSVPLTISPETAERLNALARNHSASLFMVLQSALAALLTKSGAGDDIPLGTPVAGRTDTQLDSLVGFFVNTLVLRTNTSGNPTAGELVESVRYTNLHAYANQDAPFERVVEELNPARSQHRHPLFQVMLTLQNTVPAELAMDGLDASADHGQEPGGAKFDLLLDLAEGTGGITGSLAFNPGLFTPGTAAQLAAGYLAVVEQFAADPAITLDRLRIQTPEQHARVLGHSLGNHNDGPEGTVVDAFLATAARIPASPAVVDAAGRGHGLSFDQLRQRVDAAARGLIALGVKPGDRVAVALPRTADVVTAALAVLAAGGVYIPVDLTYPAERIGMILDDGAPALVIGTPGVAGPASSRATGLRTVTVEALLARGADVPAADLAACRPAADDLAYVLYTSGSTGRPKGVAVSHGALANLYSHHHRTLYAPRFAAAGSATVAVAHIAGLGFDAAWDPMLWLVAGAELHLVADAVRSDAEALAGYCREHRIGVLETTPSYATQLLQLGLATPAASTGAPADLPLLLVLGGEAVSADLWAKLAATPEVEAYNFYGPTEFTVDSVTARIDGAVPGIGRGIAGTDTLVLDQHLALVPAGIPGELYLAGAGMAQGYDGRPGETASRFVANPFALDGSRMYRTGDLVRRYADGSLEFIARNDEQVKVRGFRIELGEIESALALAPGVDRAVALPDGDPAQRVVAYYTGTASPEDVRAVAAERLPEYMVPAIIMAIPGIPLTPHGKLDRRALPAPVAAGAGHGAAPQTADEHTMAGIFGAVLAVDTVSMDDDFFTLGGHSLLAIAMMGKIREAFGRDVPLRTLFDAPTPAALLAAVLPPAGDSGAASPDAPLSATGTTPAGPADLPLDLPEPLAEWLAGPDSARPDRLELSYAQSRMWFLNQLDPGAADYNISLAVRLAGNLDERAMAKAVAALFRRHEILRTVYPETSGVPEQLILPAPDAAGSGDPGPGDPGSTGTTASSGTAMALAVSTAGSQADVQDLLRLDAGQGFDVRSDIPLRARLIRLPADGGQDQWVLHLVMHHIASDGASLAPLAQDLSLAYTAAQQHPLPLQYADFSTWQRRQLAGPALEAKVTHWQQALAGIPAELMLPADHRRPREPRQPGGQLGFQVDSASVKALNSLASSSNASLFMALHAGLAAFLYRAGAGDDLVIGSPTTGRPDPLLAPLVGFFVNTLPLRVSAGGDPDLRTLLGRSRAGILDAFENDDVPFERLVEAVAPERELGRHPLFQTMLTVDSDAQAVPQLPGVTVSAEPETGSGEAKFDLSFTFRPGDDGTLAGTLDYNAAMFEPGTAQRLVDGFLRLLDLASAAPDTPLSALPLLAGPEARRLMAATAGSRSQSADHAVDADLLSAFAATVSATPDAVALVADGAATTFADLAASVGRIAAGLTTAGAGGGTVSVLLPRSAGTVQGLLGVLAAGAAYNPIDTEYPDHRVAAILEDAAPPVVLTTAGVSGRLDGIIAGLATQPRVLLLEELIGTEAAGDAVPYAPAPRDLASVMFTSGSTGRPKGVEVSHGALAALLAAHRETLLAGITRRKVAHTTGVGFDASWDPILWLVAGHELHVVSDDLRRDPAGLAAYFAAQGISAWETTPGYLRQLLAEPDFAGLLAGHPGGSDAFSLALGGEAFDAGLWTSVAALPGVRAWNLYGPTEATVDTVVAAVAGSDTPELGRPTPGARLYVLDDRLQHTLPGAAGELYIAGTQLARGYRGRPDLTAERFVADPFHGGGERMYRTGDVVFRHADGRLVFAGRNDGQLKIRGFRVETGEVENALRGAPGVRAAVVRSFGSGAAARLVGYVVPSDGGPAAGLPDAARSHVRALLPDYMVPAAVLVIPAVPLTPHGKVDTAALPDPGTATRAAGLTPRTPQEKTVAGIFAEVLSLDRAGVDESFFELGGHSFLARPLIAKINAALGTDLQVQSLFRAPTVEGLLAEAAKGGAESAADSLRQLLPLRTAGSKAPLFAVHPASGIGWGFAAMLGRLDPERPLIGLQMPGLEPGNTRPVDAATLTALADDYIAQISSVQPEGPYHLLGWSFGGYLAHRLATRLQDLGHEVAFLAILDAFPDNQESNAEAGSGAGLWASYLEAQGYDLAGEDLAAVDVHRAQEILRENHNPLGTVPTDSVEAMAGNFPALARLIRDERPQVFAGDLLFFSATEQVPAGTPDATSWTPYVTGTITDIPVPDRHSQLLSDRALSTIMPALAIHLGAGAE